MISFQKFLNEHVLSIGLNPKHEHFREKHRSEFHNILQKSYEPVGGYGGLGSGSKEESESIHHDLTHHIIKATKRGDKITALSIYKNQHGRKSIAIGTDGSEQGKKDFRKTSEEDHHQKRAWSEVSDKPLAIKRKMGYPEISSQHAERLTGKKVTITGPTTYKRSIGNLEKEKVIVGHPKI